MPPGIEPTRPNPALCWRPVLAVGWDYNIFLERSAFLPGSSASSFFHGGTLQLLTFQLRVVDVDATVLG